MSPIVQSLLITAIGMGLVFILIILLWGFMAAIVSLGNRWDFMEKEEAEGEAEASEEAQAEVEPGIEQTGIVAVAVAAALATGGDEYRESPSFITQASAWQAATRATALSQISVISNRKPRG